MSRIFLNKIYILSIISIFIQLLPLVYVMKYDKPYDKIIYEKNICIENYLNESINKYKLAENRGDKVYGGVEKLISDYKYQYEIMCNELVDIKYSRYSYFLIILVFLLYLIPSVVVVDMLYVRLFSSESCGLYEKTVVNVKRIAIYSLVFLVINIVGSVIFWICGVNHSWIGG